MSWLSWVWVAESEFLEKRISELRKWKRLDRVPSCDRFLSHDSMLHLPHRLQCIPRQLQHIAHSPPIYSLSSPDYIPSQVVLDSLLVVLSESSYCKWYDFVWHGIFSLWIGSGRTWGKWFSKLLPLPFCCILPLSIRRNWRLVFHFLFFVEVKEYCIL